MSVRARSCRGVTLVELLAVIAIASTLLMMAVPGFTQFRRALAMKWTARNVATALRLAQQKAATANRPCYVDFDFGNRFVTAWVDLDRDAKFDGVSEVRPVGLPGEAVVGGLPGIVLPTNVKFKSTTLPNGVRGVPSVRFASDGSVLNPGELVFSDNWGREYRVDVTLAGGITILQKIGGQWVE